MLYNKQNEFYEFVFPARACKILLTHDAKDICCTRSNYVGFCDEMISAIAEPTLCVGTTEHQGFFVCRLTTTRGSLYIVPLQAIRLVYYNNLSYTDTDKKEPLVFKIDKGDDIIQIYYKLLNALK